MQSVHGKNCCFENDKTAVILTPFDSSISVTFATLAISILVSQKLAVIISSRYLTNDYWVRFNLNGRKFQCFGLIELNCRALWISHGFRHTGVCNANRIQSADPTVSAFKLFVVFLFIYAHLQSIQCERWLRSLIRCVYK